MLIIGSRMQVNETNFVNNTADLGDAIHACDSVVSLPDLEFTSSSDPGNCTLYEGNVNTFRDVSHSIDIDIGTNLTTFVVTCPFQYNNMESDVINTVTTSALKIITTTEDMVMSETTTATEAVIATEETVKTTPTVEDSATTENMITTETTMSTEVDITKEASVKTIPTVDDSATSEVLSTAEMTDKTASVLSPGWSDDTIALADMFLITNIPLLRLIFFGSKN